MKRVLQTDKPILRWLLPLFGAGLAFAVIFYLYRGLDLAQFFRELRRANLAWIAALGIAILLEQLIQGWKWRQLLFGIKPISSWQLMRAFLAGYGANALVPLGISPLVRSWLVARLEGLRMATVLVTTIISRFVDGIVFAFFAGLVAIAGQIPNIEGDMRTGLAVAGLLNLGLFSVALGLLLRSGGLLRRDNALICRLIDWMAAKGGAGLSDLRGCLTEGIVWPRQRRRQLGIILASILMKAVAATNFLWAGLAVGVTLGLFDYLFLMVFAGFSLILTRFIRMPGGFIIGSGFALKLLGVPDEQALAMILFSHILSIFLVVGVGLVILWRSGFEIRSMSRDLHI
jgi:glycosyltransferase 2 family protein